MSHGILRTMRCSTPKSVIAVVCMAELGAMSVWFSGSAVIDELQRSWNVPLSSAALVTVLVQAGFVVGALLIAVLNLSDIFRPTWVFAISALLAAASNALFAATALRHVQLALGLRFLSGLFLAGVYPTAMKIIAGWTREHRGRALGILVGSLTIGSALPHAIRAVGGLPWRGVVWTSSILCFIAAVSVALLVTEGPHAGREAPYSLHKSGELFRNRRARLAYFGYLGHMWELYAMWAWIAVILGATGIASTPARSAMAFLIIAGGAFGCVWAGYVSDGAGKKAGAGSRIPSRTGVIGVALAASGVCCLLVSLAMGHAVIVVVIAMVWGVAIIADSAQFSTTITEVVDREYVGTALALQTSTGFLLTAISVQFTATVAGRFGWRMAVACMAIGPLLGGIATMRLRALSRAESAGFHTTESAIDADTLA